MLSSERTVSLFHDIRGCDSNLEVNIFRIDNIVGHCYYSFRALP